MGQLVRHMLTLILSVEQKGDTGTHGAEIGNSSLTFFAVQGGTRL